MEYRRQVAMQRDGDDFVIAFEPEGFIIFRNKDADALCKLCRSLRWEIVSDATSSADEPAWVVGASPVRSSRYNRVGSSQNRCGLERRAASARLHQISFRQARLIHATSLASGAPGPFPSSALHGAAAS
jgi:hypothetical protein